jgi:hypothetical protein
MSLSELVRFYLSRVGSFGKSLPLAAFPGDSAGIERLFSSLDEDYHISRFLHFSESDGTRYSINGIPATHVSVDPQIEDLL